MIDKKPLIYYCIALVFGCYSALLILNDNILGAVLAASFLACVHFTNNSKLTYIVFAFFLLGFINYSLYFNITPGTSCSVRLQKIGNSYSTGSYKGRKLLLKGNLGKYKRGQILYISGSFEKKPLYDKGVIGEFYIERIVKTQSDVVTRIYDFKERLYNKYRNKIGEKAAGEVMAASFGDDSNVESEALAEMGELGIIHVISVSGLHMAIIYKICESTLGFGTGMFIALLYCIFTGAEPSTMRSLIMILVLKSSKKVYKNYDPLSSLSLAGIIILLINPSNAHDIGAVLSFLSVLGIFLFYSRFKKALWILPNKLNEYISLTLSAQVFSLPICIMIFNSLSTASIQSNIFLVPIYSVLLVLGNISMIFSGIHSIFELLCSMLNVVYLAIQGGKQLLSLVSIGYIYMSYIDSWVLIIIYISYCLYRKGHRQFVWLPLFSIVFYTASCISYVPQIQYVKLGFSKGIIYRSGFKSILFFDKAKVKEKELFLCKKFNVWKVETMSKGKDAVYSHGSSQVRAEAVNDRTIVEYLSNDEAVKVVFTNADIPVAKDNFYDIIYLPYEENTHSYYDVLASFRLSDYKGITR